MAAEQRKLLEQLMGENALSGPNIRTQQLIITDENVCASYLVGTCPHDLFTNTKQDLGACPRVHSEPLKLEYEAADEDQKRRWAFDYDYMKHMKRYVDECDRRIDGAQRRLDKTPDEIRQTNALLKQISDLEENINIALEEIELLATSGQVNLAYQDFFKLRQYQATKVDREKEVKALSDTSGPSGHQKLQVCDVCGAYLSRLDNDRRLADHFYGKMHLGFAQMRKAYEALYKEWRGKPAPIREEPRAADTAYGVPPPRFDNGGFRGGRGGGRGGYRGGRGGGYGGGRRW